MYRRIKNAAIPDTAKHHIILPGKHRLVHQIIKTYHSKSHNGMKHILSELRQVYWILNSTAIKKIAKQCLHYRKMKSKPVTLYMADLPNVWLDYKYLPFTNTAAQLVFGLSFLLMNL